MKEGKGEREKEAGDGDRGPGTGGSGRATEIMASREKERNEAHPASPTDPFPSLPAAHPTIQLSSTDLTPSLSAVRLSPNDSESGLSYSDVVQCSPRPPPTLKLALNWESACPARPDAQWPRTRSVSLKPSPLHLPAMTRAVLDPRRLARIRIWRG